MYLFPDEATKYPGKCLFADTKPAACLWFVQISLFIFLKNEHTIFSILNSGEAHFVRLFRSMRVSGLSMRPLVFCQAGGFVA